MKGSRVSALLVGLTAGLTLTACGVPSSGVIQAGSPAEGMNSAGGGNTKRVAAVAYYFLDKGRLTPYVRKEQVQDLQDVAGNLFGGPEGDESVTATTELPPLSGEPQVAMTGANSLVVQLRGETEPFSHLGMQQLACTLSKASLVFPLYAAPAQADAAAPVPARTAGAVPSLTVQVLGDGWGAKQSDTSCPVGRR